MKISIKEIALYAYIHRYFSFFKGDHSQRLTKFKTYISFIPFFTMSYYVLVLIILRITESTFELTSLIIWFIPVSIFFNRLFSSIVFEAEKILSSVSYDELKERVEWYGLVTVVEVFLLLLLIFMIKYTVNVSA